MDAAMVREVVVGEWTLAITASSDGSGLQVEALRRSTTAAIHGKDAASSSASGQVAVCVADVEGHLAGEVLPANKVRPSPPFCQWPSSPPLSFWVSRPRL
jgi:hypothetical protein